MSKVHQTNIDKEKNNKRNQQIVQKKIKNKRMDEIKIPSVNATKELVNNIQTDYWRNRDYSATIYLNKFVSCLAWCFLESFPSRI